MNRKNGRVVSVLIPNYNHAPYLPQRIDSILDQSFQDFEIILMDDCSSDNSREVLESYRNHPKVRQIVYNEHNGGTTFKQWNRGFALAEGTYVWIAESDDYAAPTLLAELVKRLEAAPDAGMAFCQSYRADETGALHGTWEPVYRHLDPDLWHHDFVRDGSELVRRFMVYRNIVPNASAVLMRRSALQAILPAPENFRIAGDWLFWIRLMLRGKVAFVAEPLNYFRFHQRNVRTGSEKDGTLLLESGRIMQEVAKLVTPEPAIYELALNSFLEDWFRAFIYYDLPASRHRAIFRQMCLVEPGFRTRAIRKFSSLMISNRFSGLKMLIGDKWLRRKGGR